MAGRGVEISPHHVRNPGGPVLVFRMRTAGACTPRCRTAQRRMTHRGTGRKHVHGQHVKCKHAESHDAHRSGTHKANVKYKPEYMSKGNSHV